MKTKNEPQARVSLKQKDEGYELRLYGTVGDEYDGFDDSSVAAMLDDIPDGATITVRLNSPGGYVMHGWAIYQLLKERKPVEVRIDGWAASMATAIMLAAERTTITPGALVMIHNPWNIAMGDAGEMRRTADVLDKWKEGMLDIYQRKTGHDRDTLSTMMDEETWLSAKEALEWGFVDAILEDDESDAPANIAAHKDAKNMPGQLQKQMRAQATSSASSRFTRAAEPVNSDHEESPMSTETGNTSAAADTAKNQADLDQARQEAVATERKRVAAIKQMVSTADLDPSFAEKLVNEGASESEAKASVDRLAAYLKETSPNMTHTHSMEITRDEKDSLRAGVAGAILNRYNPGAYKIEGDSPARQYAHLRLLDVAREVCEANNLKTRGKTPQEVARMALHSTSDFPAITENVIGKVLRDSYELSPRTFVPLARQTTLPDFKEVSRAQFGEAPKLAQVLEGGEYTYGSIGDAAEKYRLFKYGKIIGVTWELIINDDLDAITRVPAMMGASAGQLESDLFWATITGNPNMHDGTALFHADHGNLAATAGNIDIAGISAGRAAMRQQKGLDGEHFINVQANYLVVPAALETTAEQFVSTNIMPNQPNQVNPFAGRLQVISEPRLDAASAKAWYLWANPNQVDTVEYAYLAGEQGPQVETRDGFERDGVEVKVRHCFGAKPIDWRGLYKNAGE
jgi:ATP-dependent Clp endopeptidase proteolytic subunit ClpP